MRDIPDNAEIYTSALKGMVADASYQPGNLIFGGGGRGVGVATARAGAGNGEQSDERRG